MGDPSDEASMVAMLVIDDANTGLRVSPGADRRGIVWACMWDVPSPMCSLGASRYNIDGGAPPLG